MSFVLQFLSTLRGHTTRGVELAALRTQRSAVATAAATLLALKSACVYYVVARTSSTSRLANP